MAIEISPQRDVLRYASPAHCSGDVINGSAFELRPGKDEDGLSINQLGIFYEDVRRDLQQIKRRFRLARKANGRFVQINAGSVVSAFAQVAAEVTLVEDPLGPDDAWPEDPSHGLLLGLPMPGNPAASLTSELAGDLLVQQIIAVHRAL